MKPLIHLVLFDLDGTLVDSLRDIAAAANAALAPFGRGPYPLSRVRRSVGGGAKRLLSLLSDDRLSDHDLDRAVNRFLDYYRAHLTTFTTPFPGIEHVLAALRSCPKIVVSNKPAVLVEGVLEALGLRRSFIAVHGGDSFPRKKPDPLPLVEAIRPFGIAPEACLMVGDSPADVLAGQRAGTHTCAVLYGLSRPEALERLRPDCLIRSPAELLDHFIFCEGEQTEARHTKEDQPR